MKFKNETRNNVKYRLGGYKAGYDWFTIKLGKTANMPEHLGIALKLIRVEAEPEETLGAVNHEPSEEDSKNVDAGVQENSESTEEYRIKLIDIHGIGKRTAEEIMAKYPTEKILKLAIKKGEEIHKRDDIDEAVKELFQA